MTLISMASAASIIVPTGPGHDTTCDSRKWQWECRPEFQGHRIPYGTIEMPLCIVDAQRSCGPCFHGVDADDLNKDVALGMCDRKFPHVCLGGKCEVASLAAVDHRNE